MLLTSAKTHLKRLLRRAQFNTGTIILMYHRVSDDKPDPWQLCVSPKNFEEHLQVLREWGRVMGLPEFSRKLNDGGPPARTVVLTFDDGYADNLLNALPLLERYDVPASVFVVTGNVGSTREFWWDELERILLQPGSLPSFLNLEIDGSQYRWDLGRSAEYSTEEWKKNQNWLAGDHTPTAHHRLYYELWRILKSQSYQQQWKVLGQLLDWSGAEAEERRSRRTMTRQELCDLARSSLVDVGVHTATHSSLPCHDHIEQLRDIRQCKIDAEEILGMPVTTFAYPYGEYSQETADIVKDLGLHCACTCDDRVVRAGVDPFKLPRTEILDWDGDEFAARLLRGFAL